MIEPFCDYGIGGYTYELAEGLAENGVHVDVYTGYGDMFREAALPRRHRLLPVLGSFLFRQKDLFQNGNGRLTQASRAAVFPEPRKRRPHRSRSALYWKARDALLPVELALHLRRQKYDLVWTQWLPFERYGAKFVSLCKLLGMRVAHTVHNALPHERRPGDMARYGALYSECDFLIVHSQAAKDLLLERFPGIGAEVVISPLGLYTMFPRVPEQRARVRKRLGIEDDQVALLFFGGVRPYKNVDAVLEALQGVASEEAVLIVAGHEMGYDDLVPGEPLGRTRKRAEALRVSDRVRLIAGTLGLRETAEVFEAADVALLPYTESYGSAQLLLAMTYGKFVAATRTGGMEEYLERYPRHILFEGASPGDIEEGLALVLSRFKKSPASKAVEIPEFTWANISKEVLQKLAKGSAGKLRMPAPGE
jgi:glycosyltransferase involved in cell wall biosynthesis